MILHELILLVSVISNAVNDGSFYSFIKEYSYSKNINEANKENLDDYFELLIFICSNYRKYWSRILLRFILLIAKNKKNISYLFRTNLHNLIIRL